MDNIQIDKILFKNKHTKQIFRGTFALDTLPAKPFHKHPCAYVCNNKKRRTKGQHWLAFFIPKIGNPEFFDSYGRKPQKEFKHFLGPEYKHNVKSLQNCFSSTCGQFCIYFIVNRSRGISYRTIVQKLQKIPFDQRDAYVVNFVDKLT